MRPDDDHDLLDRLRSGLSAGAGEGRVRVGCAEPRRILEAATGQLAEPETRALIDHASTCPRCAEAWQVARTLDVDEGLDRLSASGIPAPGGRHWWPWSLAAAAAVVMLAILVPAVLERLPGDSTTLRDQSDYRIESLLDRETRLAAPYRLSWSAGPEGTSYTIRLADDELDILAEQDGLTAAVYDVPESILESRPALDRVLWQVEALLPDGRVVTSATFVTKLIRQAKDDGG